jgi:hypothetical protein
MHHAVAGDLELTGEAVLLPGDPGPDHRHLHVRTREPTEQALAFLDSLSIRDAAADVTGQAGLGQPASAEPWRPGDHRGGQTWRSSVVSRSIRDSFSGLRTA